MKSFEIDIVERGENKNKTRLEKHFQKAAWIIRTTQLTKHDLIGFLEKNEHKK